MRARGEIDLEEEEEVRTKEGLGEWERMRHTLRVSGSSSSIGRCDLFPPSILRMYPSSIKFGTRYR